MSGVGVLIGAAEFANIRNGIASRRWPRTAGKVRSEGVHAGTPAARDSIAVITYRYEVAGRKFQSQRLDFAGRGVGGEAADVLAHYEPGMRVDVYYDPANPARSVLIPGLALGNVIRATIALVALVLGGWVMQSDAAFAADWIRARF